MALCLYCNTALADYDQGMRYAFIASNTNRSVSIIDLHDRRLAETIQLVKVPADIAASDRMDSLVVAYPGPNQLGIIDLSSYRLDQSYYDLSITPDYLKLDPIGDVVAVYDRARKIIELHDLERKRLLARIENVNTSVELTFNRDGEQIFWVDNTTGRLNSNDMKGNTSFVNLTGDGLGLSAMTRSVDGSMGFVSDSIAGKVYAINLRRMKLLKEVYVGKGPGRAWGTADGQSMIIPNYDSNSITGISTFTLDPIYTIEAVSHPIAVNSGWLDTTVAVMGEAGDVALINLVNKELVKQLKLHGQPQAGVVTSNSRLLAVPVAGNGDTYIFDMKTLSVDERIIELPRDLGEASLAVSNNLCH